MNSRLRIERVLFATDISPGSDAAFRYAADLATHFNARLYLLHVVPGSSAGMSDAEVAAAARSAERRAADEMRRLREQLLAAHDDYMTAVLSGQPAARILEKAREVDADVIVLGVDDPDKQSGGLAAEVAQQVCVSSSCPVTCVPCRPRGPALVTAGHGS